MKRCISCGFDKPDISFMSIVELKCIACMVPADSYIRRKLAEEPEDSHVPYRLAETTTQSALGDDRPIIDQVHEATFTDPPTLRYIADKYALRMLLRKAHRFVLDKTTSALIGDFSMAVAKDLEGARRLAVPPFPVTWFEIDNTARMKRTRELGVHILDTSDSIFEKDTEYGEVIDRCGWLISPMASGYTATYFARAPSGVFALPMSYCWHTEESDSVPYNVVGSSAEVLKDMLWMAFGMVGGNVSATDAHLYPSSLHTPLDAHPPRTTMAMMVEMAGEMRHIWGLLVALGAGQLGVESDSSSTTKHGGEPKTMPNGKPLLALEHKVLHLHLSKRVTPDKVVLRAISHHKNRLHEVRSHFRTYRNEDGSVRRRTQIAAHKRGDERLGRIEKTYRVER